jgi:hypothetical protein
MHRTKAQQFAQNRNSHGGLLKGIIVNLDKNIRQSCISGMETDKLNQALELLEELHEDWTDNYKQAKEELL